jgi:hypothetical protein
MRAAIGLFLVTEGERIQNGMRGKPTTVGAVYTYANKGRDYSLKPEDRPAESQLIPRKRPPYLIPLHLGAPTTADRQARMVHYATMAGFTNGRGFRQHRA